MIFVDNLRSPNWFCNLTHTCGLLEKTIFEESIMAGETLKFGLFWCALPQKGSPPHLLPSASGLGTLTSPSPTIMCTNNRQTFLWSFSPCLKGQPKKITVCQLLGFISFAVKMSQSKSEYGYLHKKKDIKSVLNIWVHNWCHKYLFFLKWIHFDA